MITETSADGTDVRAFAKCGLQRGDERAAGCGAVAAGAAREQQGACRADLAGLPTGLKDT